MADWFDDNTPKGDWFSQNDPAQAAPSLETQVVQPQMGLAEMLFDPETAQNLRGAVQDVVYSLPGMASQVPKMAYEGLKFAAGGPQERAQIGTEALSEAVAQGQQMSKDVMSPVGSRESFRGIANLGLMAAPAVGEVLGGALAEARGKFVNVTPEDVIPGQTASKPPIQGEALPQISETPISPTVQPITEVPTPTAETPTTVGETTATRQATQPAQGFVRLYHGGGEAAGEAGRDFTTSRQYAEDYAAKAEADGQGKAKVWSVDVPEGSLKTHDETGQPMTRVVVPDEVRKQASPVSEGGAGTLALISKEGETPPTVSETTTGADTGSKPVASAKETTWHPENAQAFLDQNAKAFDEAGFHQPEIVGSVSKGKTTKHDLDIKMTPKDEDNFDYEALAEKLGADLNEAGGFNDRGDYTGEGATIELTLPDGRVVDIYPQTSHAESNVKAIDEAVNRNVLPEGSDGTIRVTKDTGAPPVAAPVSESGSGLQASVSKEGTAEAPTTVAPSEAEVPPVSTKNEYTDAQRAVRGFPEAEQAAKRDFGTVWDEAAKEAEKDPSIGQRLVTELNQKPRNISDTENAHLLRAQIAAESEHTAAVESVNTAKTPDDLTAAKSRLESARQNLQDVYDADKAAGTKGGQSLGARRMMAKQNYTLAAMEARRRAANDGAPLNEKQLSEVNDLHEKIADLQSKLDAHEVAQRFNTEFSRLVNETRKEAKASKATTKFSDFMDRKADEARARIVERRGRLTTGFDPSMIADEAIIGASHIAKGITKFADWSVKMVDEFGDAVRPFLKDIWEKARMFHAETGKEYGEKALARYKTYLGKQTEQIQGKIEAGDFTKAERQRTKLDAEAFTMRANLQKLKNEFERGVAKEAYQKKTPAQKFWDHFVGVERAMKLSGPEVFGKLGVAAFTREALAPVESAGGYATSKLFPRLAAGTKYGADLPTVIRAEIKAKAAMFTKGISDAAQNVLGKETELDAISGSKIRPDFWYNRIGQMHAAIKAPVKRAGFTRSLEQRMDAAVKAGEDINHPEVMTRLANESVMDANRAIFQQKTVVSSFFSMLDKQVPVAGRTARFLFPVVKIPVNLFKELVTYHAGAPVAATKIGMAYWKGVETLPPIQREAIIRQFTKGSVGGAALLWGYFNSDKVRKFFDNAPQWFGHTPMAMVLNEGSYLKKLQGTAPEKKEGTKELAYMAKTDIPFMYSVKAVTDALDTHNSHALMGWINNMVQSSTVPQLSTQVAKTLDKPGSFPSNLSQKSNYRVANNPIEAVKLGIPGKYGRESVPMKATKAKNTTGKGTYGY